MSTIIRPQRMLFDGLISSYRRSPDKQALVIEGESYTYSQLFNAAHSLAQEIKNMELARGDRVAIFMDNSWACIVSIYATSLSGGVFLLINPQTKYEKLEYILNDSEAKILISDSHLEQTYSKALEKTSIRHLLLSGEAISTIHDNNNNRTTYVFRSLTQNNPDEFNLPDSIPCDLAALIYTSGSTGMPKGVMQTHQAMVFSAWSLIEYQRLSGNDRIMLVLPISFDYGLYQLLMSVKLGATLIVERSFTFPAQIYNRIKEQEVTVFPGVPTMYAMMVSTHKKNTLNFPSVSRITNTAAALPEEHIPLLHQIFPNALIYKMYGLTECKRVSYLEPELADKKPSSVGKAIPGTEIYLLTNDGKPVEPGEDGILYVRGPHVMLGYWKQPELSNKMLKPGKLPGERVLCTQDYFRMDEDGYLYFIGRSDDIIKTRGEKVSPIEVENTLHAMPGVKEVGVIGVDDDLLGQALVAFIERESDSDLTEKQIKKFCVNHLENFMVPKHIYFIDELPKSPNGKIDKKALSRINQEGNDN
jgi:acyl-CoA synthetase (AMP-forming)/AMP-acid ligase II